MTEHPEGGLPPSDQELLDRMARGGEDGEKAFEELRARYIHILRITLVKRARKRNWYLVQDRENQDDPLDAIDMMLAKLYASLRKGPMPSIENVPAYLKEAAWNELVKLNPIRKKDTREPREGDEGRNWPQMTSADVCIDESGETTVADTIESPTLDPRKKAELKESMAALRQCIETRLNERQRHILRLWYTLERRDRGRFIADKLDCTPGNVSNHLRAGRQAIKACMEAKEYHIDDQGIDDLLDDQGDQ